MFFVPSYPGENRGECLGEFESRSLRNLTLVRAFHQAMIARRTRFISFINILFSVLTKRKTIYRYTKRGIHVYFNFFHETVNSHNLEREQTMLLISFFLLHSAIKTHLWTNQIARTIQIIL